MARRTDEDLFQESTMTFGEHLEELRGALFRSIIGLAIGFTIGCFAASTVVQWIQGPVKTALREYETRRAKDELKKELKLGKKDPLPPELLTMLEAGYVPADSMLIEPFGLLDRLEKDYPDQFVFDVTPHKFVPSDFRTTDIFSQTMDSPQLLAEQLRSEGEAEKDSAGKQLWKRLSSEQQAFVREVADTKQSTQEQRRQLVGILNEVIEDAALHKEESFEDITSFGKSPILKLIGEDANSIQNSVAAMRAKRDDAPSDFSADDSRRLNRILIATYFDSYLEPPRRNVVEVPTWKPVDKRLQSLRAEETFMIWIKAALLTGAVVSSPWIFYQIWLFVAAGLYAHERKYVYLYLPISLILFFAGAALAFYFVFKHVLRFLFTFNAMMDIEPDLRIGEWLGFVLFLPVGFGISFQLPLVMLFLNRIGIFTVEMYYSKWRIAVLVIFVISMLLTPADPVSMMLMAGPLTLLYFGGIGMCRWMPKGRSPFDEAYEPG